MGVLKRKARVRGKRLSRLRLRKSGRRKGRTTKLKLLKGRKVRDTAYNSGYDTGYAKGYEKGKEERDEIEARTGSPDYAKGFEEGFAKGHHAGGNGIVDSLVPEYHVLPDLSIEEIIAAGVEHYRPQMIRLITANELGDRLLAALDARSPMSVVRLGDGELLTLAQDTVMPAAQVKAEGQFLNYAGVHVPDMEARDRLVESVRRATVVGIPKLRVKHFLPLAYAVFRAFHIDYQALQLTDSLVNYYLYQAGYLPRLTAGRRVLVVGNQAPRLAEVLGQSGVHVVAAVSPVNGVRDVPRVMQEIRQHDFDLALVSSGISAVIIVDRIAAECGKVAIDFGHLADSLVKGEAKFA